MRRKIIVGRDFRHARNIDELRTLAKRRLPNFVFEYMDSGAEDEKTLRANRATFDRWRFVPRALADVSERDLSISLLGKSSASPLIIAPTGYNGMQCQGADISLARAADAHGMPFTLSTVANGSLEDVVQAAPNTRTWLQLYMMRDKTITENLLARAAHAGCDTLVLTVDAVYYGNREWDRRCYRNAMKLNLRNKLDVLMHPRWMWDVLVPSGVPRFANIAQYMPPGESGAANGAVFIARQMETALDWNVVAWLREKWQGNLLIKGVLHADDAKRAVQVGANGIVVTNHGGRQLDGTVATLDVLDDIVQACGDALTIIVDSGFRRGTDVVKALCLGANAVMIGRAALYGLAAGGQAGAKHALSILHAEIDRTLAQLGCASVAALSRDYLRRID